MHAVHFEVAERGPNIQLGLIFKQNTVLLH